MRSVQRIAIIGCSGAGKSTLAKRLVPITGLPLIHLDAEFWNPGWIETPKPQWLAKVTKLVERERWIIDGNFGSTQEMVMAAADVVLWLDFSRWRCLFQAGKRIALSQGRTRADMGPGCPEKIDWEFFEFIWNFPVVSRPKILRRASAVKAEHKLVVLQSPEEVERIVTEWNNHANH